MACVAALTGPLALRAQNGSRAIPLGESVENDAPSFYVHAEVDRPSREYQDGDYLTLRVTVESDAHMHIMYQQSDGKIYQLFPNKAHPDNFVKGGATVEFPSKDDQFRWRVRAPFGKETIKVLASKVEVKSLDDPEMKSATFNPVSNKTYASVAKDMEAQDPSQWTEVAIDITTYPRDKTPGAPGNRRFGVFFGASTYRYSPVIKALVNNENGMDLRGCHKDAEAIYKALVEDGKLTEGRVYGNEQATRANMEEAITRWLPSVTRPGDTVFITFSGHGGQINDNDGDEQDQKDELITPHDMISGSGVLAYLIEHPDMIPAEDRQRVQELWNLRNSARDQDSWEQAIARRCAITDDTFGHWLQKLSGRQVIVILDTCHSGGFATNEKSLQSEAAPRVFDYLESEVGRLKDIGQSEQAVFTAAKAWEVAQELPNGANGVMTLALIDGLHQMAGPVRVEQAYEYCHELMPRILEEINKFRVENGAEPVPLHEPHLQNSCTLPVFFKP